jgi:hypothetical protein
MKELQTQLFQETKDWQSGQGSYAPGEGAQYDPASDQASGMHYQRIQPLLEQQAMLSGKSPLEVRQALQAMEKERYAQTTVRAAQLVQSGDVNGIELLKGPYNKMFKDGRTLNGGAFNPEADTFTLNYTDKDGSIKTHDVKRDVLANQYMMGALVPADAVKLTVASNEKAKDRAFEGGENNKNRDLKRDLNKDDNAAALERTKLTGSYGLQSARISKEGRDDYRKDQLKIQAYNDFEKDIDNALGASNRNSGIPMTPEERSGLNSARSAGRVAFDTTYDVLGSRVTGPQFLDVMEAHKAGRALVKDDKQSGLRGVEYNGVRVVVPITSGLFAPQKK